MRVWCDRETKYGGARCRGIGLRFDWGSTGSTYGEPGENMFFMVQVGLWWLFNLNFTWKRIAND